MAWSLCQRSFASFLKRVKITDETIEAGCANEYHYRKEATEEAMVVEDAKKRCSAIICLMCVYKRWSAGVLLGWKKQARALGQRKANMR
eukprot:scaffold175398_cov33-Prasinocladus_malaysianus.AAC.2